MALFFAVCVLSVAAAADWLLSVLGVVAAALDVVSVEVVVELLLAVDWFEVLGVVFAAAVLSEVLVFEGGACWDMVLEVGEP